MFGSEREWVSGWKQQFGSMQTGICYSRGDDNCGGGREDATAIDSPCAVNGASVLLLIRR